MLRRAATVGSVMAAAVLAAPVVAWADGWGTVDCSQAQTPQCQLAAGATGSTQTEGSSTRPAGQQPSGGGGSSGNLPACAYARSEYQGHPSVGGSGWRPPDAWYEGTCSLTGVIRNPVLIPRVTAADVAELARAQLGLPEPTLAADPAGDQLVNLPTWLWITDGWETVTATASVPGVSVTATATPTSATWTTGDGTTVDCAGPGSRFPTGSDPRAGSPDCGHTYSRSSVSQPGGTYPVETTVRWTVTWSGAGESGTFPEMTTTGATRFRVAESQALNTGPR